MLFLERIIFLIQILCASENNLTTKEDVHKIIKDSHMVPIKIVCADNITVILEPDIWKNYEYFLLRQKYHTLYPLNVQVLKEDFNSKILLILKQLTLSVYTKPLRIFEFIEILRAIEYFLILDSIGPTIHNTIIKNGLDCGNINDILKIYNDLCNNKEYYLYRLPNITFQYLIISEVLKIFGLSLKIYDKTLDLSDYLETNIFENDIECIENVTEFKFNLYIFNNDKVINDLKRFTKIMSFLMTRLISKNNSKIQIQKLFINGKCTSKQFKIQNLIFSGGSFKISKILIKDFFIDHNQSETVKSQFEIFIEKFQLLKELDLKISYKKSKCIN
ncbi:hypothetical protein DMUE_5525 [Dictyocoela muelleri]|nr:hypothetical protein DMUE_5525 [Dictyocoela muelleri]